MSRISRKVQFIPQVLGGYITLDGCMKDTKYEL